MARHFGQITGWALAAAALTLTARLPAGAQVPLPNSGTRATTVTREQVQPPTPPADYVIGPDDVLSIVFWRDRDMSADVTVRPDGKISLPLLNEVQAAGYTPEQLRARLTEAASEYVEEPNAAVLVREIHSRRVFITGNVTRPAAYPLTGEMNVVQLIAIAGGLLEFADSKNIVVMRKDPGRQQYFKVNYNDVVRLKNVKQNITLKPGDTVVVP